MSNSKLFLVFGPQGSGKSTQAKLLAQALKVPYFDAGDQLRVLVESRSELGKTVQQKMQLGQLVDNATLGHLFENFMAEHNCQQGLVADGFPRNIVQAELLEDMVKRQGYQVVGIYIDISDQTAKDRLAGRFQMVNGKKVVRSDDQPSVVAKRLEIFKRETLPVVDFLEKHHQLYRFDGNPSIDQIHQTVLGKINE